MKSRWNSNSISAFVDSHIIDYPMPKNLNCLWSFGSLAGIFLGIQIVVGIFLAFDSVEHIMRDVNNGWLLRYVHANTASLFFIAVYSHIFRGIYYGSYLFPRQYLWLSGVVIFLLMMATAFMGYVLPWGQMSFWGATVITNLFSAIPVIGDFIVEWLWGGFSVENATLNRFFSLHYTLPFLIAGLVIVHLSLLHSEGSNNSLEINTNVNTIPFYPYFYVKDLFTFLCNLCSCLPVLSDAQLEAMERIIENHIFSLLEMLWDNFLLVNFPELCPEPRTGIGPIETRVQEIELVEIGRVDTSINISYSTINDVVSVFYYEGHITTVGYCTLGILGAAAIGGVLYSTGLGTKIYVGAVGLFGSSKGNGSGDLDRVGSSSNLTGVSSESNLSSSSSVVSNLSSGSDAATPFNNADFATPFNSVINHPPVHLSGPMNYTPTTFNNPISSVFRDTTSTKMEIFQKAHKYVKSNLEELVWQTVQRGYNKDMTLDNGDDILEWISWIPEYPDCQVPSGFPLMVVEKFRILLSLWTDKEQFFPPIPDWGLHAFQIFESHAVGEGNWAHIIEKVLESRVPHALIEQQTWLLTNESPAYADSLLKIIMDHENLIYESLLLFQKF